MALAWSAAGGAPPAASQPATAPARIAASATTRPTPGREVIPPTTAPGRRGPFAGKSRMTEVVGFTIQGRKRSHRVTLDDLGSIVVSGKTRLLTLLRVLRAFEVVVDERNGTLYFTPRISTCARASSRLICEV